MAPRIAVVAAVVGAACALVGISALTAVAQEGRDLFIESCSSCHGVDGSGTEYGPSIEDAGEAAADFQLRTGRMPLTDPDDQTMRKEPAFSEAEIEALVDYVGSLGGGPEIPEVDVTDGDLSEGQTLFVDNCAACHGATANGGAAGVGALAPSLYVATPVEIAEAMVTGPGEMPVFAFDEEQRNSIIHFIHYLQTQDAPGGADIGGIGPVPEGFIGWAVGMLTLGLVCWLVGSKVKRSNEETP